MRGLVYKITNNINGKMYIGKTLSTLTRRKSQHITEFNTRFNENKALHRAFCKYGIDNFTFSVIDFYDESILSDKEKEFIDLYNTYKNGYNMTTGGDGRQYLNLNYDDICKRYLNGETMVSIASEYNCHAETIKKVLINYDIPLRNRSVNTFLTHNSSKHVVRCTDKDLTFPTKISAARWLKSYLSLGSNELTICSGISTSCKTGKPYHNFKWEVVE